MPRKTSLPNIWLPPSSRPTDPMQLKASLLTPPLTPSSSLGSSATGDYKVSRVLCVSPISSAVEDAFLNFTFRIALKSPGDTQNPIHSISRTPKEDTRVVVLNDIRDAVALQELLKDPPKIVKQYLQGQQVTTAFLNLDQFVELCGPLQVADVLRDPAFRISVVEVDGDPEASVKAFLESKGALCSFRRLSRFLFEAEFFNLSETSDLWDCFKASPISVSNFILYMHWSGGKREADHLIYSTTTPTESDPAYRFPPTEPPPLLPPPHILPLPFSHPPPLPHIMSPSPHIMSPPPPPFFHGPTTPPVSFQLPPMFLNSNGWYDCLPGIPGPPPPGLPPPTDYWLPVPPPSRMVGLGPGPIQNESTFVDTALANVAFQGEQRQQQQQLHQITMQLSALTVATTTAAPSIETLISSPCLSSADTPPSEHSQGRHDGSQPPSPASATASPTVLTSTPKCNQLSIARITSGVDTRTTVMIKNIPNKMNRDELIKFINQVAKRRFDFLYLRMDFSNNCNFGYAFVNFITVEDLLNFAQARLGHKWNMFQSEKVLEMCYANYQGKEAAIEKFKNSSIMDEREDWRPKIFYSEPGPRQGLSEPFPKPTHQRRRDKGRLSASVASVNGVNGESGGADSNLISGRNTSHTRSQNHHADLQMLRPGGGYRSNRRNRGRNAMMNGNGGAQAHVQSEDGQVCVPSGLVGPAA